VTCPWFNAGMHRRLSLVLVALLLLVAAVAPPAAAAPAAPHPDNRPTPVRGHANGELPDSELIAVTDSCRVHRSAAPSLRLLLQRARDAGIALGLRSCYRPLDQQVAVRQQWTDRGNSACAAAPRRGPDGRPVGTSMHGWGKAVDFSFAGGPMTFGSAGYRWLQAEAARYGWNQPGWARQGGGPCPEAWHWEWVGDGGTLALDPVRADVVGLLPLTDGTGHTTITGLGAADHRGNAADRGSAAGIPLRWVMVGGARAPGGGYWMVAADGGVFSFGDARFFGSTGSMRLKQPIVGMAATPSGRGYWLVAADGGVFSFGDARFFGSTGAMRLQQPIVAMAAASGGAGYWLAAADGGIFTFGSARFHGSLGGRPPRQPIVAVAATGAGDGYWLTGADGTITAFGAARVHGQPG
jgi:hypothetical protein